VCKKNELTRDEVIKLHTAKQYLIYVRGFVPGFLYLGGLSHKLHTPRKAKPALKVAAGSVGIGNDQTGIYPFQTPGGWNIIGRTPIKLFDINQIDKYKIGDKILFKSISLEKFKEIKHRYDRGN